MISPSSSHESALTWLGSMPAPTIFTAESLRFGSRPAERKIHCRPATACASDSLAVPSLSRSRIDGCDQAPVWSWTRTVHCADAGAANNKAMVSSVSLDRCTCMAVSPRRKTNAGPGQGD